MNYIYHLKNKKFNVIFISLLISFNFFFWDVKIFDNYGLREIIVLTVFFFIPSIYKNNFNFIKSNKTNLVIIFSFVTFLMLHQILNTYFDGSKYTKHNFLGILGLYFLFFFIYFYYDLIMDNLDIIIGFFLISLSISYFFSSIEFSSIWEVNNLCSSKYKFDNKHIFQENSHLGMMIAPVFGYLLYKNKDKGLIFHFVFLLIIYVISLLEISTTFVFSFFVTFSLILFFDFKYFFKKIFFLLFFFVILSYNLNQNNNCFGKINETVSGIDEVVVGLKENNFRSSSSTLLIPEIKKSDYISQKIIDQMIDEDVVIYDKNGNPDLISQKIIVQMLKVAAESTNNNIENNNIEIKKSDYISQKIIDQMIDEDVVVYDKNGNPDLISQKIIDQMIDEDVVIYDKNGNPDLISQKIIVQMLKVAAESRNNNIKNKFSKSNLINKQIKYVNLPRKQFDYNTSWNLSSGVLINALNIGLETVLSRPLGWGLNRYENAFDYYMFINQAVVPYVYHEVFTLNYNDGSANLPKLFTEFGIITFLIFPILILFLFSKKISTDKKILFLGIICIQLIRGAGYFSGGFMFSLIIILFTVLNLKSEK